VADNMAGGSPTEAFLSTSASRTSLTVALGLHMTKSRR
jgi:hypothetical protein